MFSTTVPVFADDIVGNTISATFYVDSSIDMDVEPDTGFTFKVPLWAKIYSPNITRLNYLSGYIVCSSSILSAFPCTVDGHTPNYMYFEPLDYQLQINRPDNTTVIYFDNYHVEANSTSDTYRKLVGYLVYTSTVTDDVASIRYSTSTWTPTITSTANVTCTDAPLGFVRAIVDALGRSETMEDIYTVLNKIDINTGYLDDILAYLQIQFPAMYSLLQNVWNTDTAILSVNRDIYNTVLRIFALLDNQYGAQESQAENIADDINTGLNNLAQDINVTRPSAVADIADNYISQIDTTYNSQIFSFVGNNIIILMLCLVFAFSVLSYMLFGGQ